MTPKKGRPTGPAHPNWKGGKPKCKKCGKKLINYDSVHCRKHSNFLSNEAREHVIAARKRQIGKKHPHWKGDQAGYRAIHYWVIRKLGQPSTCVKCGRTNLKGGEIQWANISGKYKRVISDWKRMCRTCHMKRDAAKRRNNKRKKYEL